MPQSITGLGSGLTRPTSARLAHKRCPIHLHWPPRTGCTTLPCSVRKATAGKPSEAHAVLHDSKLRYRQQRLVVAYAGARSDGPDTFENDAYTFVALLLRGERSSRIAGPQQQYTWVPYRDALYLPLWLRGGHNEWWRLRRVPVQQRQTAVQTAASPPPPPPPPPPASLSLSAQALPLPPEPPRQPQARQRQPQQQPQQQPQIPLVATEACGANPAAVSAENLDASGPEQATSAVAPSSVQPTWASVTVPFAVRDAAVQGVAVRDTITVPPGPPSTFAGERVSIGGGDYHDSRPGGGGGGGEGRGGGLAWRLGREGTGVEEQLRHMSTGSDGADAVQATGRAASPLTGAGGSPGGRSFEWELSVSCFGPGTSRAERLVSWTRVYELSGGDLPPAAALLAAEQQLQRLPPLPPPQASTTNTTSPTNTTNTTIPTNTNTTIPTNTTNTTSPTNTTNTTRPTNTTRASVDDDDNDDGADNDASPANAAAAAAAVAAARAASGVGVAAGAMVGGLSRTTLDEVSGRPPSAAQRVLLRRLARTRRLEGLTQEVILAIIPEGWAVDVGAGRASESESETSGGWQGEGRRRRSGNDSGSGSGPPAATGSLSSSASPCSSGMLLYHVLTVHQLAEAEENAREARAAAAAAAAGLPPPITRRQLNFVRTLLRQAARGVEADGGPWLRSVFRGVVPQRDLKRLVAELVGDDEHGYDHGGGSGDMMPYKYGRARDSLKAPLEELLGLLSRESAATVIERLRERVGRLPNP